MTSYSGRPWPSMAMAREAQATLIRFRWPYSYAGGPP